MILHAELHLYYMHYYMSCYKDNYMCFYKILHLIYQEIT